MFCVLGNRVRGKVNVWPQNFVPDLSIETQRSLNAFYGCTCLSPHNVVLKTDFMPHVQVAEKTHDLRRQPLWSEQRAELSAAINCIDVDIGSDWMTRLVTGGTGGNIEYAVMDASSIKMVHLGIGQLVLQPHLWLLTSLSNHPQAEKTVRFGWRAVKQ